MNIFSKLMVLENEAKNFGFKWDNTHQILEQIQSECEEVKAHLNDDVTDRKDIELQEEIGDLLHAVYSLCMFCKFNPEDTLNKSVEKFERRFKQVKKLALEQGFSDLNNHTYKQLIQLWEEAKILSN